jgi:hypothetical protein
LGGSSLLAFWTLFGANGLSLWALGVGVLSLIASIVAAVAAIITTKLALRRPVLDVEDMVLGAPQMAPFIGEVGAQQERYEGPEPDYILSVVLSNHGHVPALRVGGTLTILSGPAKPINYPGYENIRIQLATNAPAYVMKISPSNENRAPVDPTYQRLRFDIPFKLLSTPKSNEDLMEMLSRPIRVVYRFDSENGDPIEGEWIVRKAFPPPAVGRTGRVPDSERALPHRGPTPHDHPRTQHLWDLGRRLKDRLTRRVD